ncbi:MAG: NUDIX domain-containing protein [Candidatus Saccharimonas sp.]|nr:NUDIX domain-containing protein [Candidatus Saccharimonas sp.]
MNIIASFDQHKLGHIDPTDQKISFSRQAARAVLTNQNKQIAVMNFTKNGSFKLPGGGVDDGEDIVEALHREIEEETGYHITNIKELGVVEEDRYFCGMHQTSYCFTADVTDFVGTKLTEHERSEGMNLRWAQSIDEAISWVKSGNTVDEDGSAIGLAMMQLRDSTILDAAREN